MRSGIESEAPAVTIAGLRGVVDVDAGTLTFDVVAPRGSLGGRSSPISAAIYGDQGVTVRVYNSPVTEVNPSSPGKKTYSADVGLRNLLPHGIGDEQAAAAPLDTMGIFVFVNSGPTVVNTSSPCTPSCSVTVRDAHGTRTFTSLIAQPYWYWLDVLGAAGSPADTTRLRNRWVFEADTQVRVFAFDVLVSAAWANPNETRWKVEYPGDSFPDLTDEPRWKRVITPATPAPPAILLNTPSPGMITATTLAAQRQYFPRYDSLASTTSAYMEARFQTNTATTGPEISFGLDDDTRFIAVGVSETSFGFLSGTFGFLGASFIGTTATLHTYQIRKLGGTTVELWVDGVLRDSRAYGTFPASITGLPRFLYFGGPGVGFPPLSVAGNSSSWDYVIYEIGVSQP